MHEHGLGVRRDYTLALAYYDLARMNAPAGGDVDQRLNGMPVEVLVFLAKLRFVKNTHATIMHIRHEAIDVLKGREASTTEDHNGTLF